MECRTPLLMKVRVGIKDDPTPDSARRYNHARGLSPDPVSAYEKISLPIPKNHVLMCLMEAAQQISENDNQEDGYESGEDDELVLRGMKVLGSSSGTYSVREPKGLKVYPFPPKKNDTMPTKSAVKTLKFGQTVQISRFENKIATVARGAGYILVDNSSQLTKVGEVTDEVCKLDATKQVIEMEIEELDRKVEKLKEALMLLEERRNGLSNLDKGESVFGPIPEDRPFDESASNYPMSNDEAPSELPRPPQGYSIKKSMLKHEPPAIAGTQSYDEYPRSLFCAPVIEPSRSFENMARYIRGQEQEERQSGDIMANYFSAYWTGSRDEGDTRLNNPPSTPSPSGQRNSIDFSSGLSGHVGLSRARMASSRHQQRRVMMMSHY